MFSLLYTIVSCPSSHYFSSLHFSLLFFFPLFSIRFLFYLSLMFTLSLHTSDPHLRMVSFISPLSIFTSPFLSPLLCDEYYSFIYPCTLFMQQLDALELWEWAIKSRDRCVEGNTHMCAYTHKYTHFSDCLSSNLSIIISSHLLNQHSIPSHKLSDRERWRKAGIWMKPRIKWAINKLFSNGNYVFVLEQFDNICAICQW